MPTHQNPTIRQARPTDREALIEMRLLMQRHMENSNPRIWRITQEGRRDVDKEIDDMLNNKENRVVVAEENNLPVGYTHGNVAHRTKYTPRTVGFINGIYVLEPHRQRGLGTRLIQELLRYFRDQKVEEVNLRYVLGNKEGEKFWKGLGVTPVILTTNVDLETMEKRAQERLEKEEKGI